MGKVRRKKEKVRIRKWGETPSLPTLSRRYPCGFTFCLGDLSPRLRIAEMFNESRPQLSRRLRQYSSLFQAESACCRAWARSLVGRLCDATFGGCLFDSPWQNRADAAPEQRLLQCRPEIAGSPERDFQNLSPHREADWSRLKPKL